MDTDSIFVPPEIANIVSNFFDPLNPYEEVKHILKIEDKFKGRTEKNGKKYPIQYFLGISSKRYVVFAINEDGIPDITKMEGKLHGLGHITNIFQDITDKKWFGLFWKDVILYHNGKNSNDETTCLYDEDIINKYNQKYEISKIAIRTPTVLNWFAEFNNNKPYVSQIKPFNFFLRGMSDNKNIMPIAPRGMNFQDMAKHPFIDAKNGNIKNGSEYFKPMDKTFRTYYNHPEIKFEGESGLLKRRNIFITEVKAIGKEIDQVKLFEDLPEIEGDHVQVFEKPENLFEKVRLALEEAKLKGNVRKADIERIKKELIEHEENESLNPEIVKGFMITLKRTYKNLIGNYHLPTQEEREIILNIDMKTCKELGLKKDGLMKVKQTVRRGESLNLNLIYPKILVNYCKEQIGKIELCTQE